MTVPDTADAVPPTTPPPPPGEELELKLPDESSAWKDLGLWAGVLVLLTLVAYWPAVSGRFVWLDARAVAENRLLARPGGLAEVWFQRWQEPTAYPFPVYQPVAFTADWLAYRLGGHDEQFLPTPTAYHAVALAAHAAAAVLVWLALRELAVPAAWLVAAVSALHPVNAEAVSWVFDGGVPVGGVLFWASVYCYLLFVKSRTLDATDRAAGGPGVDPAQTWGLYAGAVAAAVLGALAWPAAGAAPAVVLLGLWWRRRATSLDAVMLVPVFLVTAALWLANAGLPGRGRAVPWGADGQAVWFAVAKVLAPVHLSLLYGPGSPGGRLLLLALTAGAVAAAFAVGRGVGAGVACVVLCTVPALNGFDPARRSVLVDPVAYLAVVPLAALALAAVARVARAVRPRGWPTEAAVVASAVLLLALGAAGWARARVFATPSDVWADSSAKVPGSAFARASLAEALRGRASEDAAADDMEAAKLDLAAAADQASTAVALDGGPAVTAAAQHTWAASLVGAGDAVGGLTHFAAATADVTPGREGATVLVEYGQTLLSLKRYAEAVVQLDRALAADPLSAAAHRELGRAYGGLHDATRQLREEQLAVDADPGDLLAQQQLAESLAAAGRTEEAVQRYVAIFQADKPSQTRPELWEAVAKLKDRQGAYDQALAYLRTAQQLAPELAGIDAEVTAEAAKLKRAAVTRPAMTQPTTAPAVDEAGLP